jgi:hypothetical protein
VCVCVCVWRVLWERRHRCGTSVCCCGSKQLGNHLLAYTSRCQDDEWTQLVKCMINYCYECWISFGVEVNQTLRLQWVRHMWPQKIKRSAVMPRGHAYRMLVNKKNSWGLKRRYNGYRVSFWGVKQTGRCFEHHPFLAPGSSIGKAIQLPLFSACFTCNRTTVCLLE